MSNHGSACGRAVQNVPAVLRVIAWITRCSGILVGIGTFLIALFVTYEVLGRTLLGETTGWVNDISTYMMGFIAFGGTAYALQEEAHVRVDLVVTRVSSGKRRFLAALSDGCILLVTVLLVGLSAQFWWDAYESNEQSWGLFTIPLWIPYTCFFLGMVWLLIVHLAMIVERFRTRHF